MLDSGLLRLAHDHTLKSKSSDKKVPYIFERELKNAAQEQ